MPQGQYRLPDDRFGPAARPTRILCLSGGGYRGLFAAHVLARIEEKLLDGRPIGNHFDLFAGTSVGGLVACGLALGHSAAHLRDSLVASAPRIFPKLRWRTLRKSLPPPYDPRRLREAIETCIGAENADRRLDEIDRGLLLPAVSWVRGELRLLRSRGLAGRLADPVSLVDAALATTAAPGHFPAHRLAGDPHLDGGLCANAPDALAVSEAVTRMASPLEALRVLSIGTAGPGSGGMPADVPSWGFRWPLRALALSMSAQERLIVSGCQAHLGPRYLRINQVPAPDQRPLRDLDVVDASSTGALLAYAEVALQDLLDQRRAQLDDFLR